MTHLGGRVSERLTKVQGKFITIGEPEVKKRLTN